MIILSDYKTKLLLPQRKLEWDQPSDHRQIGNVTRWRLTARVNDGAVVWRGWFDDREDADAFMWAMCTGSLVYERELWRLPTPAWCPGFGEDITYESATFTVITSTSTTSYTIPNDWGSLNNAEGIAG